MKRLKFLLLVGILACAIGCQNQNPVMVPIDDYIDKNIEEDIAVDVETTDTEEEKKNLSVLLKWVLPNICLNSF